MMYYSNLKYFRDEVKIFVVLKILLICITSRILVFSNIEMQILFTAKSITLWILNIYMKTSPKLFFWLFAKVPDVMFVTGMDRTKLIFMDWRGDMILGNNVSKVVIRDLHLTRSTPGAMQGFVTKVTKGQVYLEIPPGEGRPKKFPSRQLIFISSKSIIIYIYHL